MNSAKSVEYASGILNQIFVNFNLAKLITNYLMSASDSKIMVKVGQKEYFNINAIQRIQLYKGQSHGREFLVLELGANVGGFRTIRIYDTLLTEKIVTAIGNPDLIQDFNELTDK